MLRYVREGVKKPGYFTVRLTAALTPLRSAFNASFGLLLTLYYDYMCSKTDFTEEKGNFHQTTRIPNSIIQSHQMIICKRPALKMR